MTPTNSDTDLDDAAAQIAAPLPPANAGARARALVRAAFTAWGAHANTIDNAVLVTSELVANAEQHADGASSLILTRYTNTATVSITDSGPAEALPTPATPADTTQHLTESGRGLLLIQALADTHWVERRHRGKSVTALLPCPAPPP